MKRIAMVLVFLLLQAGLASGQKKTALSVMDLNITSGITQQEAVMLTDKLLNELVQMRRFEVVERSRRDEILKEQGFQMTGACDQSSCLVEAGQLLGAQKMVGGTIGRFGAVYAVELRMIDIGSGKIDQAFSRKYAGDVSNLLDAMREAAEIFSSWKPGAAGQSSKPGGLFVVTEPDGAKIIVDGKEHPGLTPNLVYPLSEGLHQVSLVKEGYSLFSTSRLVSVGKVDTVSAPLMSLAGKLKMKTNPVGARLYLNNKYQGLVNEQGITIEDLTDSLYQIKAAKWGYHSHRAAFSPNPGRETKIDARLFPMRWTFTVSSGGVIGTSPGKTPSPGQDITDADFGCLGPAFMAGLGYNISRHLSVSLMYQFRFSNYAVDKDINLWRDTAQIIRSVDADIATHSALVGVSAAVAWGRFEPYGEARIGVGRAAARQTYADEYLSLQASVMTRDSIISKAYDDAAGYINYQAGGGIKLWLSQRSAVQVNCLYNSEALGGYPNHFYDPAQEVDLKASGLMVSMGHVLHF
ncbi:PEGA domain-containing protein [candidate division TA06 bacterium]|uniref:PEGA domain-containing protein n=1 Tax=candidate division TA06 bacterium TaxID=2250710 RepID=A0A933IA15_UNCT6|nr:PEGA domain-containing protein [candidate division TA06 bacterium]